MEDTYHIPTKKSEGFYKEKASKFISFLYPVYDLDDIEIAQEEIKAIHPKARHICYAYRLSPKEQTFRINDDGEPSGTAGKPIYGQIQSANLHNVFIAVVRYFGGTKLGASGLIRAYKTAALEAIVTTESKEKYDEVTCKIEFAYAMMGDVMNVVKSLDLEISDKSFETNPFILVQLRELIATEQIDSIKAKLLNRDIADIKDDTCVPHVNFEILESL